MNLLLLFPEDFVSATRVRLTGRHRDEIARIGGEQLRVGVINGRCGVGKIVAPGELEIRLDSDPPPPLPITLVLPPPRPTVLNPVIPNLTSTRIHTRFLLNASLS